MANIIHVLYNGYSNEHPDFPDDMLANCTCTLIKGENQTIVIDTMTAWDRENILKALQEHDVDPDDVTVVISTHGHSDHVGNNNLFQKARHIVGNDISERDRYFHHDFSTPYELDDDIFVIATPGHTRKCVSVIVRNTNLGGVVAITGDLFEKFEDIDDSNIWLDAGSFDEDLQRQNRLTIAKMADVIVPGHGPPFEVTDAIRSKLTKTVNSNGTI